METKVIKALYAKTTSKTQVKIIKNIDIAKLNLQYFFV